MLLHRPSMDHSEPTIPTVDAQEFPAPGADDILNQIGAVYSLEIQKHRLLIQQARRSLFGTPGSSAQQASATEPDFVIRPGRAA